MKPEELESCAKDEKGRAMVRNVGKIGHVACTPIDPSIIPVTVEDGGFTSYHWWALRECTPVAPKVEPEKVYVYRSATGEVVTRRKLPTIISEGWTLLAVLTLDETGKVVESEVAERLRLVGEINQNLKVELSTANAEIARLRSELETAINVTNYQAEQLAGIPRTEPTTEQTDIELRFNPIDDVDKPKTPYPAPPDNRKGRRCDKCGIFSSDPEKDKWADCHEKGFVCPTCWHNYLHPASWRSPPDSLAPETRAIVNRHDEQIASLQNIADLLAKAISEPDHVAPPTLPDNAVAVAYMIHPNMREWRVYMQGEARFDAAHEHWQDWKATRRVFHILSDGRVREVVELEEARDELVEESVRDRWDRDRLVAENQRLVSKVASLTDSVLNIDASRDKRIDDAITLRKERDAILGELRELMYAAQDDNSRRLGAAVAKASARLAGQPMPVADDPLLRELADALQHLLDAQNGNLYSSGSGTEFWISAISHAMAAMAKANARLKGGEGRRNQCADCGIATVDDRGWGHAIDGTAICPACFVKTQLKGVAFFMGGEVKGDAKQGN